MKNKKIWIVVVAAVVLLAVILCVVLATGGGKSETTSSETVVLETAQTSETAQTAETPDAEAGSETEPETAASSAETLIQFDGTGITADGPGAVVNGATVTITQAGTYRISGTLEDGQLLVDADGADEIRLVLDGMNLSCAQGSPMQILQAGSVTIELAGGSENTVSDTDSYLFAEGEDEPAAAIYAKDDLHLTGEGTLTVNGNYSMAIHGKDTVTVEGGTYRLFAVGDGLKGKDEVIISGGDLTIEAGEDGIQGSNDKDADLGNVVIQGGSLNITAGKHGVKAESGLVVGGDSVTVISAQEDGLHATGQVMLGVEDVDGYTPENGFSLTIDAQQDGVQADGALTVSGGEIQITTGGGSANAPEHTEQMGFPGWFNTTTQEDTVSAKGLKAGTDLTISGGTIAIDALDDAVHGGGAVEVSGEAALTIATGDDGMHSDDALTISGGTVNITKSYEGLEGMFITISGGDIQLVASDDGINAAGGTSADTDFAFMGPPGGAGTAETLESATYYFHMTGGTLRVDAGGDGLDSNGAMFIDGGEVYVSGPTNSGNGGLDYTTTGQVNGGIVVVAGASGMAQNFDTSSAQPSLYYAFSVNIPEGSTVSLTDAAGQVLVETEMAKSFNSVVISLPELTVGETYTLTCGTETAQVTLTEAITSVGGGMGGMGGMRGGPGGMMPPPA